MREFGQVRVAFWSSPDIQALTDREKLLALYMIAGPHTTIAGCFRCPLGYVSADLGWSEGEVVAAMQRLFVTGFLVAGRGDWQMVAKYLHHNRPQNQNQWKAIGKILDQTPESSGLRSCLATMIAGLEGVPKPLRNRCETVSEPFANKEKEKEKEKELDQEKEKDPARAPLVAPVPLKPRSRRPGVEQVAEHYCQTYPKNRAQAHRPENRDLVAARLADHSPDDLCRAIDGMRRGDSEWYYRKGLTELSRVMKDEESVCRFMALADAADAPVLTDKSRQTIDAVQSWTKKEMEKYDDQED